MSVEDISFYQRDLEAARSAISEQEKRIAELEAERAEAHAIVSRVWKALGISKYADAQGKAIDEIVADLLESHKRQLRERREEELREDERLGKAMARAEAAEQALTSERQRREGAEAIAKPLADVLNGGLRVGAIGPDSEDTDSLYVQLSVLRAAQAYLHKYEPIPADREEERDG